MGHSGHGESPMGMSDWPLLAPEMVHMSFDRFWWLYRP